MRPGTIFSAGAVLLVLVAGACSSAGSAASTSVRAVAVQPSGLASNSVSTSQPKATTSTSSTSAAVLAPTTIGVVASTTTAAAPASISGAGGVDPNAPEVVAPGDIPDNQVFIAFTAVDGSYSVKVPEGWARTEANGAVVFTDKYNSVTIQSSPSQTAPTPASIRASGLADVSADPTFHLNDVQPVTRKAGVGVLATFEIGSAPNAVTGKKALLAVERYVFFHHGSVVVLTLSGAKGADNVDPWKTVSNSLTWTS